MQYNVRFLLVTSSLPPHSQRIRRLPQIWVGETQSIRRARRPRPGDRPEECLDLVRKTNMKEDSERPGFETCKIIGFCEVQNNVYTSWDGTGYIALRTAGNGKCIPVVYTAAHVLFSAEISHALEFWRKVSFSSTLQHVLYYNDSVGIQCLPPPCFGWKHAGI